MKQHRHALRRAIIRTSAICSLIVSIVSCRETPAYRDSSLDFETRADDLISRMTLEEKVAFLRYDSPAIERLGSPAYNHWNECLHGVARAGKATVFPQAIGMAAMWDREMMHEIGNAVSDEARAKYNDFVSHNKRGIYRGLTFFTPNINIVRDPRWGRGMETYGEDPYLTGETAVQYIRGLQGDDPKYLKSIATAKHFAVHSGPEYNRHSFDVKPSDYDFLETYTPQFKKVVQESKVASIMCAYNRLDGMPCCGNKYLSDLLRKEWGFDGYIVSDCWAIADFYNEDAHNMMEGPKEAAALAVRSGTDLNCGTSYKYLVDAVNEGLLTEDDLNKAVKRIIIARMKLGQFDRESEVPYSSIPYSVVESEEHRSLARKAAQKSIVLLKNSNGTLPFSKDVKKIAVIGPNGDDTDVLLANYNGFPTHPITLLDGIKTKITDAEVVYAPGCRLAETLPYLTVIDYKYLYTDSTLTINGLIGEYYRSSDLSGKRQLSRIDSTVDFRWWNSSPAGGDYEHFSVKWSGYFVPPVTGEYYIGGEGFNGFTLYIDNTEIAKCNDSHQPQKRYEKVSLEGGKAYPLLMTFFQNDTEYPMTRLLWEKPEDLESKAIDVAEDADIVILCMGLSPQLEGEEMPVKVKGFEKGDRLDIQLPQIQSNLARKIMALGKPTALVLCNGSAVAINWEAENIPAILEVWYPGQEGGNAVADVLFGDYNPSGKLPVTFYRNIDDIPEFDDYSMDGRTYRYFKGKPLYEFGYGLSYTTFDCMMDEIEGVVGDTVKVTVHVTNTGSCDGEEVVQLFASFPNSKLKAPLKYLVGYERVFIPTGDSRTVTFAVAPQQISLLDKDNKLVQMAGPVAFQSGNAHQICIIEDPVAPFGPTPSPQQLAWQKMEYYMFVHFGPNTFTDVEWGDGKENPEVFAPEALDCRQWAKVAKNAGMTAIIITAKHHDGFCLWPSKYSSHTVRESKWRGGKGDVLQELSEACKAEGIKLGVYISPWDQNHPAYGTPEYNEVFANTIKEVHARYGPLFEQWFDGANGSKEKIQEYDWPLFNNSVYLNSPYAVIFSDVGPGCHWVGNENGFAGETNWSRLDVEGFEPGLKAPSSEILNHGNRDGASWIPAEADVSIRPGWFYSSSTDDKVKSVDELMTIYCNSVGRNANLILNVPPDRRGRIHPADSARLMEFRAAREKAFGHNLAANATVTASNTRSRKSKYAAAHLTDGLYDTYWTTDDKVSTSSFTINLDRPQTISAIMLQEYIALGQRIESFKVECRSSDNQPWVETAEGTTIGYKRILRWKPCPATAVKVTVKRSRACPVINNVELY